MALRNLRTDQPLPSEFVNADRLWRRHIEMAKIGATPRGGVNRQALSLEDAQAQLLLIEWAKQRGFECSTDDIGNLFVRRAGANDTAPPVMAGSHLDSQPSGGKFDGASGVLTAFEALEVIADQGLVTKRPIEIVSWTNEEGSRFELGCMGSQVFVDRSKLGVMTAQKDAQGSSVAEALAEVRKVLPPLPLRPLGFPIDCFVELHIEQGPILEAEEKTIGIVTGVQGSRKFLIEVEGEEAHAGTVPHKERKDALFAAIDMIAELRKLMDDPEDVVRFTVGRLVVSPGAQSVVPGRAAFTIDFRHPDEDVLTKLGDQIAPICEAYASPCKVSVTDVKRNPSTKFDGLVAKEIEEAAQRLNIPHMRIASGAGHDARYLASVCDSGMIFIPCEKGISHNELENALPDDIAAGARVMTEVLVRLANR